MSAWDNPQEMLTRAEAARAQGDRDLAYQLYARASELNPQDAQAWQGRAEMAANPDEQVVSYGYATALAPDNQELARRLDESVALRVGESNVSDAPLLVAVGQDLAEVGLQAQAQPFFERAVELDPGSADALVWLAGTEQNQDKQIDYLERALAANARDPRARAGLLAIKQPAPAMSASAAPESSRANPAADATAQAESSMARLRALRDAKPSAETAPRPAPASVSAPPPAPSPAPAASRGSMRFILVALFVLVVLLLLVGVYVVMTQ